MGLRASIIQLDQEYLEKIIINQTEFLNIDPSENIYKSIDLDKSWDGIIFLLSNGGTYRDSKKVVTNISRIILSGQNLTELDNYGITASYLTSKQVKQCINELIKITEKKLYSRFDSKLMSDRGVYDFDSFIMNPDFKHFFNYYQIVKEFYNDAAKKGKATLTYIS
ncbi:YfbM family protein [Flaviramulus sp. BrNp1-15]|uniref:DUF1877 family protein n=1 Tax=Flaviramulus sp. BrNp1-15 TaxID=2916754 RepID=UPI001EE97877|nr:DUF1877 family protein [Flaviramulus sp. BrNp1-15]ULC58642.1 YfbM family protein [Flaviramulus sp. BrNp1-15]